MTQRSTRGAGWSSLTVAATLLAAGCSAFGGDATPGQTTDAPSASSVPSASSAPSAPPSGGASAPVGPGASPSGSVTPPAAGPATTGAPAPALASRDFSAKSGSTRIPVRFDLVELKRRGDLLDLTAHVTNLSTDRSDSYANYQVGRQFVASGRQDLSGLGDDFSGAVLTDLAGKKRYLVAADSAGACVCTTRLNDAFIDAGQGFELSATYAAPPVSTTRLDVQVPSLGTFRDLPIT